MLDNTKDRTIHIISGYDVKGLICESFPSVIFRAIRNVDKKEVVIKTLLHKYPNKEHIAVIRREHHLTNLAQSEGVIKVQELVHHGQGNLAIILEPFGISLEQYLST